MKLTDTLEMMLRALSILIFAGLSFIAFSGSATPRTAEALSKSRLVNELKIWADENEKEPRLDPLEKDLRKEFIFRLRFQTERRYDGSDASLLRILNFMKELEESPQNRSLSQMNDFLGELIRCIQMNREPAEPLFSFLKTYAKTSGLVNPQKSEEYALGRAYLNGSESRGAQDLNDEDWIALGELYDQARAEPTEEIIESEAAPTAEVSSDLETPESPDHQAPDQNPNP